MEPKQHKLADSSSLLSLKAELFRKTESVKSAKSVPSANLKPTALKVKGEEKTLTKRTPTAAARKEYDDEEEKLLIKSKAALESKAKLYDEIVSRKRNMEDDECLVNFHKKRQEIDLSEGRHRTPNSSEADEDKSYNFVNYSYSDPSKSQAPKEEPEIEPTGDSHYQNVLFNEVRDHGVGYFAFSEDASKRKEEMDRLKSLHTQTGKEKKLFDEVAERKRQRLEDRLKKISQRRNISESVVSSYATKKVLEEPAQDNSPDNKEDAETVVEEQQNEDS